MVHDFGLPREAFGVNTAYAPKLSSDNKCEVLALIVAGVHPAAIASAYNISMRTVYAVRNPDSGLYGEARRQLQKLGDESFTRVYITDEVTDKIREALRNGAVSGRKVNSEIASKRSDPNPRANRFSGEYAISANEINGYSRQFLINVEWRDDRWGFTVLNLKDEELRTFFNGVDPVTELPFRTSAEAYNAAASGAINNLELP